MDQSSIMMEAAGESMLQAAMLQPGEMERAFEQLKSAGEIHPSVSAEEVRESYEPGASRSLPRLPANSGRSFLC
jgi:hypothetical protein